MDQEQAKKPNVEENPAIKNKLLFKLNEPVTTALNVSSMATINSVNDESSLSFVVLGKDSMENVQASLLASYVDIQQKCMSVDYKTMVSSLSIDEMQQRLTELLQENVKLKETLKQNNASMKQQFHILATWQEEVMKVHENHKQKFTETRELINQLKKENADLKTKLLQWQQIENMGFEAISAFPESAISIADQIEFQQSMLKLPDIASKMEACEQYIASENLTEKGLCKSLDQSKVEKELESAMKSLSCCETSEKTAERQECSECSAKHQEIMCLKETIASEKTAERQCSECSVKHQEIIYLKGTIASLEERMQSIISSIPCDLSQSSINSNRQKFIENMKQYDDILRELTACFVGQIERFPVIETNLKEITEILMLLDDDTSKTQFYQYREKLCHFCKQLADEHVKIITDRQTLIKSQNQFQKILSDYNSILYELQITIDENAKLNVLKNNTTLESLQKSEKLEHIKQDKQLFEEEKRSFDQEKINLEEEKRSLEDQKRSLDEERDLLYNEKRLLVRERISLHEEKKSLDQQSQLYENCEKALQNEKKTLQQQIEKLVDETNGLRQDLEKKNTEFKEILEHLAQSTEEINLLRSQLTIYEEDFQHEKKLKEALLEEKSKLDSELQKQVNYNKQLQESGDIYTSFNVPSKPQDDNSTTQHSECPKCELKFHSLSALLAHIESCLEF